MKYKSRTSSTNDCKRTLAFSTLLLLLFGCSKQPGTIVDNKTLPEFNTLKMKTNPVTVFEEYPATVRGKQDIEIRSKADGYIEKIFVDEGALVKQSQPLFKISAPQYEQEVRTAQAAIKIAEADVRAAEMQVERVKPLVQRKIVSKYDLETAEYTLQSKKAALAQAEARLQNANINLGYTLITSPADGVIGNLPLKVGSLVTSSTTQPLTTVSNISTVYAYFSINEKQFLGYRKSNRTETSDDLPAVSLILADGSEYHLKGKIEAGSGIINTETGSMSVRASFLNPENLLRSGSTGIVRIPQTVDSAIMVPQSASYEIQGKRFVYLILTDGTVKSQAIVVAQIRSGTFFIVEEGLKEGDQIVVDGLTRLRDGLKINPKVVNADSVLGFMPKPMM